VQGWLRHWREYISEACCLALFMISATTFALLLQLPQSPVSGWATSPLAARVPMGIAMGLTAAALIYSPLGRRSGAHMNPAVTIAFLRLGKIPAADALAYVVAQFAGGALGVAATVHLFHGLPGDPVINYVATAPGAAGPALAFAGELAISFVLMATVLAFSATSRVAPFTGVAAAMLVALFIIVEAPLSGMSMNPARSLGSALFAHSPHLWIYFTAPPVGMLAAAEAFARMGIDTRLRCAKLHHHPPGLPCIFHCDYMKPPSPRLWGPRTAV
jgi:aquaporin Z